MPTLGFGKAQNHLTAPPGRRELQGVLQKPIVYFLAQNSIVIGQILEALLLFWGGSPGQHAAATHYCGTLSGAAGSLVAQLSAILLLILLVPFFRVPTKSPSRT
jgi:hypothetical protein